MPLTIPGLLNEKLVTDKIEMGRVLTFVGKYETILDGSRFEFFPEYTDHGVNHINEVLKSAEELIPELTWPHLNAKDVSVLVQAIVLHDLGMHLSVAQFSKLVQSNTPLLPKIDSVSWRTLWINFLDEAMRFSPRDRVNILGSDERVCVPNFHNPSDHDKRLIGEFIRRHHPRICHELSIGVDYGFIKEAEVQDVFDANTRYLAGLVGRSHGMALRDTIPLLRDKYPNNWQNPINIKVIYLMVIVRIADYLQIHRERAPALLYRLRNFRSPISQKEWEAHNCIDSVVPVIDNTENISVDCSPVSTASFLKLKALFEDIQFELDKCWAVLGEVYGLTTHKNIGIRYRRLVNNLSNKEKELPFIPQRINYTTDSSVLKLLIKPLYNSNPGVGIRELLQNSLDACQERKLRDPSFKAQIKLSIVKESGGYTFVIQDNGVGMSENTLLNYYFRAGASFRNSKEWVSKFTDTDNNSLVIRTGKFGIGALAVFLLGDELELSTRHAEVSPNLGLQFASIYSDSIDDFIEVRRSVIDDAGTVIRIVLNERNTKLINDAIFEKKKLDWLLSYVADNPSVEYHIDTALSGIFTLPSSTRLEPYFPCEHAYWRKFVDNEVQYFWTFDDEGSSVGESSRLTIGGKLSCNGFALKRGFQIQDEDYPWLPPRVSVIDRNGKVDLSLDRNSIVNDQLPNENMFLRQICYEIISELLSLEFEVKSGLQMLKTSPEYVSATPLRHHIYCGLYGYVLNSPTVFASLGITRNYNFWLFEEGKDSFKPLKPTTYYQVIQILPKERLSELQNSNQFQLSWYSPRNDVRSIKNVSSKRIYVNERFLEIFQSKQKKTSSIDPALSEYYKSIGGSKTTSSTGEIFSDQFISGHLINSSSESFILIEEAKFSPDHDEIERKEYSLFAQLLTQLLENDFIIPYSYTERQKKYKAAFELLGDRIELHRKTR